MCISEWNFIRFHGDRRTRLRLQSEFTEARRGFDYQLRRTEGAYKRNLSIDIESTCTNDPRAFWDHIENLGPKKKSSTPLEVYDDNGNNQFYVQILRDKRSMKNQMLDPLFEENPVLNLPLNRGELKML